VSGAVAIQRFRAAADAEKSLAGLDDPVAVAVLERAFGHGVTPSDGRLLYNLIVRNGYQRGLDIGTAQGYSACWLGLAMKKTGGRLITLEIVPARAEQARANFRQAGLAGVIDSRIGDALVEIPKLAGDFDFVFMDTGMPLNKKFLDLLYARITPGGMITAHNANRFKTYQPDFLRAIENDPNLETRIIPTTSGGISVTVKKRPAAARP
jgi:predicted O-methyltransferase YrrM